MKNKRQWLYYLGIILKWILIVAVVSVLFVAPVIVIWYMFSKKLLDSNDWGEIIGGCLGYYGTIILGLVAIFQTRQALKQSSETFIADKFSTIRIQDRCYFKLVKMNKVFKEQMYQYPINQFIVYQDKKNKDKKQSLSLTLKYNVQNQILNKLILKGIRINYSTEFYIDSKIVTDICETPKTDDNSLEILFVCDKNIINKMCSLIEQGKFILELRFDVVSGCNVSMQETITLNFSPAELDEKLKLSEENRIWSIDNVSYNYRR